MSAASAQFDTIVIGAGHNGLTCAAWLARAGQRVAVVEARTILGGFTTTETPFANYPQVLSSMAAMDIATGNLPPCIVDELDLGRYGLKLLDIDPFYSFVAADGSSVAFWRDVDRTCAEIAVISKADAVAYRDFTADMLAFWRALAPYMHTHPTRPGLSALARMAMQAARAPARLARAARMLTMSPRAVLDCTFESPALRAALANFAAASTAPLDQPGSGIILAVMAMQHEWGVRRPVGGMGALSDALAAAGARHGATYLTGKPVVSILMKGGRAAGVELAGGETIAACNTVGALDPKTLMTRLLPPQYLPAKLGAELRGLGVFSSNIASARVDLLVRAKPGMVVDADRADILLPTSMLIGPPDVSQTQDYIAGCCEGRLGDGIPIWAAIPSMLDPGLGTQDGRQTFYIYVPAVPYRLAHDQPWAERRGDLGDKVVRRLESVMPQLASMILAKSVRTPDDLAKVSGLERGCMYHADMSLSQMGPWRPTPCMAGYRTPVAGLWHTGAGAHPMASVNGLSGKLAAQALMRG